MWKKYKFKKKIIRAVLENTSKTKKIESSNP